MSMQRFIPERKLAELLGMSSAGLADLRREGRLHSDAYRGTTSTGQTTELKEDPEKVNSGVRNAVHYYTPATIDGLFSAPGVAKNFTGPLPTAAQLLAGDDRLLSVEEAFKMLGKDYNKGCYGSIARGYLPVLNLFCGTLRIPASAVAKLHANLNSNDAIEKDDAALLLGVGNKAVRNWVNDPNYPLQRARVDGKSNIVYVTRGSLRVMLRELLPDHVTVDDWWQYRIHHQDDMLLTALQLENLCHVRHTTIMEQVRDEKIPYIKTPGGRARIPMSAVRHLIAAAAPVSAEKLAIIFGGNIGQVNRKQLCAEHASQISHTCPRFRCVLRYIEQNRTHSGVSPKGWIEAALEDTAVLVIASDFLAAHDELTQEDVDEALAGGRLAGVWLPRNDQGARELVVPMTEMTNTLASLDGVRRTQELALLRRFRQQQRLIDGPDYHLRIDEFFD